MMKFKHTSFSKNQGFTLIEVLVATVISVAMLTLVMSSFWTLWQTYKTSELLRDMQHEATFALTRIADKVRNYGVDYSAYIAPGRCVGVNVNENLCVKDPVSGEEFLFSYKGIGATPGPEQALFMGDYTNPDLDPLFSHDKFLITHLRFDKFPDTEPTRQNTANQFQPKVMIAFRMQSKVDVWGKPIVDPDDALSLDMQTTISSRNYDF